jgi:hypothetical protein
MTGRAEFLYADIKDRPAIDRLIGESEDGHLDCKVWPDKEKGGHEMLAKAICGFANSDGGVLVIGMRAKQEKAGDPDVIKETACVRDASSVRSRILTLIGQHVEPPIAGIETRIITETPKSKSGFIIVYVPKSGGPPHRSRKDSKFYIRVGSSTLPMEYWQIEDRFGSRPHPKLELHFEIRHSAKDVYSGVVRHFAIGLKNSGVGIAKFPGIMFKRTLGFEVDSDGLDGLGGYGIRKRPSEGDWIIFGGGVDDVVYPGQTVMIAKLKQEGKNVGINGIPANMPVSYGGREIKARFVFRQLHFLCEISCEGCQPTTAEMVVPEGEFIADI